MNPSSIDNETGDQNQELITAEDREPQSADAAAVTILLSDWTNFGLSERICYHFDLIEVLPAFTRDQNSQSIDAESLKCSEDFGRQVCGVVGLLECVPTLSANNQQPNRQRRARTKGQREALKTRIQDFNNEALTYHTEKKVSCHQPSQLPLRLSPTTRVSFAYEMTKIAFCLDASPTLVSMFGVSHDDDSCCSLDRIPEMAKLFFESLIKPITAPYQARGQTEWNPVLAVTVLAVFPRDSDASNSSLLVRNFRVFDQASAAELSRKIGEWALGKVENQIAARLSSSGSGSVFDGYDYWTIPKYSTLFRDILDVGDVALSLLPATARPCIVVATDARSVACDGIVDLFVDRRRLDIPVFVLDLSTKESHAQCDTLSSATINDPSFLSHDPGGSSAFPLHLSDDSESLHGLCKATGGAFFDMELLIEATHTFAGQIPEKSPLADDHFLVSRRRTMKPNSLQWYLICSLSPLSPTLQASSGRLVPPSYLRKFAKQGRHGANQYERIPQPIQSESVDMPQQRRQQIMTKISIISYKISPVRIKELLLARIQEGYRTKQYRYQNTVEKSKLSIVMTIPLELETVLHYELQYTALESRYPMVGVAYVKLELSGDPGFIQLVWSDFLSIPISFQQHRSTIAQKSSARLCNYLRRVRKGDELYSELHSRVFQNRWINELSSQESLLASSLSSFQLRQFFRRKEFNVICKSPMPYVYKGDCVLSHLIDDDNGEEELYIALGEWSSQIISAKRRYIKAFSNHEGLTEYSIVNIDPSPGASRLFRITIDTLAGTGISDHLILVESLKERLSSCKDIVLPDFTIERFLTDLRQPSATSGILSSHFSQQSWNLVNDSELLPLITIIRSEIANFWLIDSSDTHARFARLEMAERNSGNIVDAYFDEYCIEIREDKTIVNMHVEQENGHFFMHSPIGATEITRSHQLFDQVKRRDHQCGVALRARTQLLGMFRHDDPILLPPAVQVECLTLLHTYASRHKRKLRYFSQEAATANRILEDLTINMILSDYLNVHVIKLNIRSDEIVAGEKAGNWFLINFNRRTLGFLHLALVEEEDEDHENASSSPWFRELTFFTVGMTDLADNDSTYGIISDYPDVKEIADSIDTFHGKTYASAAYAALCVDQSSRYSSLLDESDIHHALSFCSFVEVAKVYIPEGDGEKYISSSKLREMLEKVLAPVPGKPDTQFYFPGEADYQDLDQLGNASFDDDDDSYRLSSDGFSDIVPEANGKDLHSYGEDLDYIDGVSICSENPDASNVTPPIFVRFSSDDGRIFSLDDLLDVEGLNLNILVSVFKEYGLMSTGKMVLPLQSDHPQSKVASELKGLLKAYAAEQTLESLRRLGSAIDGAGMQSVQQCLRKARHVSLSYFDIYFYSFKSDTVFAASDATGNEIVLDAGFSLFRSELLENGTIHMRESSQDTFCVIDSDEVDERMKYWCFVSLKASSGVVTIEVFHPMGLDKASTISSAVQRVVYQTGRRVNQLLLLKNLHGNRVASSLLIAPEIEGSTNMESKGNILFGPNSLSCPIKYTATFKLFHRCLATQVILAMEASVLHSFAVSNRRGYYVYKDEMGAIFYMKLDSGNSSTLSECTVELKVYGVQKPGPSITRQLKRLLQKKLLSLSVDALSWVLTKNPSLNWRKDDLHLVQSYRQSLAALGEGSEESSYSQDSFYEFPEHVYDPLAVFIFFRQNLCGSTFFHRLYESSSEQTTSTLIQGVEWFPTTGIEVEFDRSEFMFFYNNAPSPLDSSYQHFTTLTKKGSEYARDAGNGIALIELSLINQLGDDVTMIQIGPLVDVRNYSLDDSESSLRMRKLTIAGDSNRTSPHGVRVRIVDTDMNRSALHNWLQLTLNQVLVAWSIERHIERAKKSSLTSDKAEEFRYANQSKHSIKERQLILDQLCPGLPKLIFMCQSSYNLPHPVIDFVEYHGAVKASSVATLTLTLLERSIMGPLIKGDASWMSRNVFIIRLSREERPRLVNLNWDSSHQVALIQDVGLGKHAEFKDVPTDCPEYMCFYCHQRYCDDENNEATALSLFFKEVVIEEKLGESKSRAFIAALHSIKKNNPSFFMRSLCFVLNVKRNIRSLMTYNWDPRVLSDVKTRVKEFELSAISSFGMSLHSQQRKCLGVLSPPVARSANAQRVFHAVALSDEQQETVHTTTETYPSENKGSVDLNANTTDMVKTRVRQIHRPTLIRKPKLVGKSVEGAAVQAVAASRARASSNRVAQTAPANKDTQKDGSATRRRSNLMVESSVGATNSREMEDEIVRGRGKEHAATEAELARMYGAYTNSLLSWRIPRTKNTLLQKRWIGSKVSTLSLASRNLILLQATKLYTEAVEIFSSLTRFLDQKVTSPFITFLRNKFPGIQNLETIASRSQDGIYAFLVIQLKSTRCIVFRFLVQRNRQGKDIGRAEMWLFQLPLSRKRQAGKLTNRKNDRSCTSTDLKLTACQNAFDMETQFFNFSGHLIKNVLVNRGSEPQRLDALALLQQLIRHYPYNKQEDFKGLHYNVLEATIVLATYQSKNINIYDSQQLFNSLETHLDKMSAVHCGYDALCFLQSVIVQDTCSYCFLVKEPGVTTKLKLQILCRNAGQNIEHFMIPEFSSVATKIVRMIVAGAAKLALDVLESTGYAMRKKSLWSDFSTKQHGCNIPQVTDFKDFLNSVVSVSLLSTDDLLESVLVEGTNFCIDLSALVVFMKKEAAFFPYWSYLLDGSMKTIFYIGSLECFFLLDINEGAKAKVNDAKLLTQDTSLERQHDKIQKLSQMIMNYILHFMWQTV